MWADSMVQLGLYAHYGEYGNDVFLRSVTYITEFI